MKPFEINDGHLKINGQDLVLFLERYGIKTSLTDVRVKPVGIIIQCQIAELRAEGIIEEMLTDFEGLIDPAAETDVQKVLYPIEHAYFAEDESKIILVPAGDKDYERSYTIDAGDEEHFAKGGEIAQPGIDYVLFQGEKVQLFNDELSSPEKVAATNFIQKQIAEWVELNVEKMNPKLFDKSYAFNQVIETIRKNTAEFETPFIVSENSVREIIQKTFE
jgi:hypothetical protein